LHRDQVANVAEKRPDDESVADCAQAVQGPGDRAREVLILENAGLEFKHQQQDNPGGRIDGCRVGADQVTNTNAIRIEQLVGKILFGKKPVHVHRQKDVNGVLEGLKQGLAANCQPGAPFL
jgi:hypothetical protein